VRLEELYVHPAHRSRGAGHALVEPVLARAKAHGVMHVLVGSSNVDWERTIRFYQSLGLSVLGFDMGR